jgi:anti-anti-sigma factor
MGSTFEASSEASLGGMERLVAQGMQWWHGQEGGSWLRPFAVELLLRESLTNAVTHGVTSNPAAPVRLQMRASADELIIEIHEPGDPWQPQLPLPRQDELAENGRGLLILIHYATHLAWDTQQNCLRMRCVHRYRSPSNSSFHATATAPMIKTLKNSDALVLIPQTNLAASHVADLRTELLELTRDAPTEVLLDLSSVEIIDSSGIGLIIALNNSLQSDRAQLKVIEASEDIYGLLTSMRLDRHFPIARKSC